MKGEMPVEELNIDEGEYLCEYFADYERWSLYHVYTEYKQHSPKNILSFFFC